MKRIVVGLLVSVSFLYVAMHIKNTHTNHFILSPHACLSSLSTKEQQSLKKFIKQHCATMCSAEHLSHILQKQFPLLKKITFISERPGNFQISVECARPLALINQGFVLTDNDSIVSTASWNANFLTGLPDFMVKEKIDSLTALSQGCKNYIKQCDPAVHKAYAIEWTDSSHIALKDRKISGITVLASAETSPAVIMQPACAFIKNTIIREKTNRKGLGDWYIDARFKDQMVVFPGGKV